jgi:hypothetical protein
MMKPRLRFHTWPRVRPRLHFSQGDERVNRWWQLDIAWRTIYVSWWRT